MKNLISLLALVFLVVGCIPDIEKTEIQSSREEIVVKDSGISICTIEVFKFMYDNHRWIYFAKTFYDNSDFEVKHDPECPKCYELKRQPEE